MAKSQVTFNKIEKEKKRLKKREDKQKKKEARRAEAKENPQGIQFAYVDHNGNLTDTPPDPSMKVKVDVESIEVGIPKKEEREPEEPVVNEGKVAFFDTSKGFGFITDNVNGEKYFVHVSGLLEPIAENDKVTFDLERGQKGMNAVAVKKI
ncbi:cold-shock protein [Gaetbulibacter saemankumensis]|uniref:cold-shock protein n=1 Tax=Gaetbulibacter saemankumensis TaxID=311208 RepID=UPI0004158381|nr:cold shock domain-containing protein [Gaetbulibacter saemankumensis]